MSYGIKSFERLRKKKLWRQNSPSTAASPAVLGKESVKESRLDKSAPP